MPAYNSELYIIDAIESVIAQTYCNFELIIVDDGSIDNTANIIKNYMLKDPRIRGVFQNNKGVSTARNTGVSLSNNDFLAFLDSDDLWNPKKLETYVEFYSNNYFSLHDYLLIYSDYSTFSENSKILIRCKTIIDFSDLFINNPICTSTVLISKKLFILLNGFSTTFNGTEDWDLWLRAAESRAFIHHIRLDLTNYRILNTSLSRSFKKHYNEKLKVYFTHKNKFTDIVANKSLFEIEYENLSNYRRSKKNIFLLIKIFFNLIFSYGLNFLIFAILKKVGIYDRQRT